MPRFFFLCLPLLLIGGCTTNNTTNTLATTPVTNPTQLAEATPEKVCTREFRVGSNIPYVTCEPALTEVERQRRAEETRRTVEQIQRPIPGQAGPGQ